jgi:hypothetical protein
LEEQELHPPPEPAELTLLPLPPALLKLQADRSLSIVQDPHWGHFSGNLPPKTNSSKVLLQLEHLNSKSGISHSHVAQISNHYLCFIFYLEPFNPLPLL